MAKGHDNLIPVTKRSKDEARTISASGGRASGKARRERKQLREELMTLLETGDTKKRISAALVERALNGDVKAFITIRDTIGERPSDRLDISQDNELNVILTVVGDDDKGRITWDEISG